MILDRNVIDFILVVNISDDSNGFEKLDLIKKYFSRIFTVLSKEVRHQLMSLGLSKEELKEIKKEIAFLSEEEQINYLEELSKKKD